MPSSYSVTVIDTLQQWRDIAKHWDDLLTESSANTIFLTWEWLYTWTECFLGADRELFILAVSKGGELIGVAPWCIHHTRLWRLPVRSIEFLGTPETGSDYLDVLSRRRNEKDVAQAIYRFLFQDASRRWDRLTLRDIPSDSLFLLHFLNQYEADGKYAELTSGSFCPQVSLPEGRNPFLATLSRGRKKQYLRDLRILKRDKDLTHHSARSCEVVTALPGFLALYSQRWDLSANEAVFLNSFASRSSGKEWIQIDLLESKGRPIAGIMHLRYQGTQFCYRMVIDRSFRSSVNVSVGNVLVGLSIEEAIEQGL